MDCRLSGSSVHGIFQVRVLEWVAICSSRVSSGPRDQTQVSHIAGRRFTIWATRDLQLRDIVWIHWRVYNSIANTSKRLSTPFWCLCQKLSLSPLYFNKTLLHKSSERSSLVSGPGLNSPPEAKNPGFSWFNNNLSSPVDTVHWFRDLWTITTSHTHLCYSPTILRCHS